MVKQTSALKMGGLIVNTASTSMGQSPPDTAKPFIENQGPMRTINSNEFMDTVNQSLTMKNGIILVLVFLLVLSFLGVNLLTIAGNIIQFFVNLIGPFVNNVLSIFGYTAGSIINISADVVSDTAKTGIDIAEGTVHSVGNLLRNSSNVDGNLPIQQELNADILGPGPIVLPEQPLAEPGFNYSSQLPQLPNIDFIPPPEFIIAREVEKLKQLTNTNQPSPVTGPMYVSSGPAPSLDVALNQSNMAPVSIPESDTTNSPIQSPSSSNTSSWCFIGEDQGGRGCVEVSSSDKCLSGQTFTSQQLCTAKPLQQQQQAPIMPRTNGTAALNWGIPPVQAPPGSVFNPGSVQGPGGPRLPQVPLVPQPPIQGFGVGFNNVPPLSYNQPLLPGYNGMPPPRYVPMVQVQA